MINPEQAADWSQVTERHNKIAQATDTKRTERREKVAARITRRAVRKIEAGQFPVVVKGAHLPFFTTPHSSATYASVGEKLAAKGIDVKIHSIHDVVAVHMAPFKVHVSDIISPTAIQNLPVETGADPLTTPAAFDNRSIASRGIKYIVEQVYPPQS